MGNQVLVAYATKSGSTKGVAKAIGQIHEVKSCAIYSKYI